MRDAIRRKYDTLFASLFRYWDNFQTSDAQVNAIRNIAKYYKNWGIRLITRGQELDNEGPNMILSLEGGDAITCTEDVQRLYDMGIRCITLQYGTNNSVADAHGLTDVGKKVVKKMFDLKMIVDIAHAFPITRQQILTLAESSHCSPLISYTHGSMTEDIAKDDIFYSMAESRGMTKEEVLRLIRLGGYYRDWCNKTFLSKHRSRCRED